jgi:nucleoside 2-deoxyribosyltransferase
MFTDAEVSHNLRLARKLREKGFVVYCPNENATINDKTRIDITPENVYLADIAEVETSNVFVCQVAEDSGTMWESGYMDCLSRHVNPKKYFGSIGLATDMRLKTTPDLNKLGIDNQSFAVNAFIAGGLKLSLGVFLDEDSMIEKLEAIRRQKENE